MLLGALAPTAFGLGAGGLKGNYGSGFPQLSGNGNVIAFYSDATNLTPDNLNGGFGLYVRDLDTGIVKWVPGDEPALSGSGRYLAFRSGIVYVRDLQTGAQTLASRADGPNGAPAEPINGFMYPDISADGTKVVFETTSALDPADTDGLRDIYLRDLSTDTTKLISRATGAAGVKSNDWSERPSISSDGRFVAFESLGTNLDPNDTDRDRDIFVRDLKTNTTTLASVASPQNSRTLYPSISTDGRYVAYEIVCDNCGAPSIYRRDRQSNTTEIVYQDPYWQTGAEYPVMSSDGRFVAFQTSARLDPADTDEGAVTPLTDVYVRDMQAGTYILVSRATGANGADGSGGNPAISGDGRFVAFATGQPGLSPDDNDQVPDIYVRDLQASITSLEHRATPGYERYVRPRGATPLLLPLVPAAEPCSAPNRTHGSPLAFGSCAPVVSSSPNLTVGVGDGDPALARSVGSVRLDVIAGNPVTVTDESDVNITFKLTNVMRRSDLSDYTGELQGRIAARITDKANGTTANGSGVEGTVEDFDLAFTVPCVETSSTLDGGLCSLSTTADTVLPGFAPESGRTLYGLGQLRVYDGGPDEDADTTGNNSLLAVQGVFVP